MRKLFIPVNISALTSEIANSFRGPIEKAGLYLDIDAPTMGEPMYLQFSSFVPFCGDFSYLGKSVFESVYFFGKTIKIR